MKPTVSLQLAASSIDDSKTETLQNGIENRLQRITWAQLNSFGTVSESL